MKIAVVNTNDLNGGAARAAHRLYLALSKTEDQTLYIVNYKSSDDIGIVKTAESNKSVADNKYAKQFYKEHVQVGLINKNRSRLTDTIFSFGYPGLLIDETPEIIDADIINIHWVNNYLSPLTVGRIINTGKPIFWTLHDMWPFTGGCHYAAGCEGFQENCQSCPQLKKDTYGLPGALLQDKLDFFNAKNLTIVTPSNWMREQAQKSTVFKNHNIVTIPNSIDHEKFTNKGREATRKKYGISEDDTVLLFGAVNGRSKRKGFDLLSKAVACLVEEDKVTNLKVLCFGHPNDSLKKLGLPVIDAGYSEDDDIISGCYAAADIFILPSREDNLPNTILEAFSCETPVISFAVGGIADLIENGHNGYKVEPFDYKKLASKINILATDKALLTQMSKNARKTILEKYTMRHQAKAYKELFNSCLNKPIEQLSSENSYSNKTKSITREVRGSSISGIGMNNATSNFYRRVLFGYYQATSKEEQEPKFSILTYFLFRKIYRRVKSAPIIGPIATVLAPKVVSKIDRSRVG